MLPPGSCSPVGETEAYFIFRPELFEILSSEFSSLNSPIHQKRPSRKLGELAGSELKIEN